MIVIPIFLLILYLAKLSQDKKNRQVALDIAEKSVNQNILEIFGDSALNNFKERQVWIGMPKHLVIYCWGEPHDKKQTLNDKGCWETWLYEPQSYRYGGVEKYKHNRRIEIYNSIVTEISM